MRGLGLGVEVLKKQRGIGFFQLDRLIRFRRRTPRIDFFSLLESDASSSRDVHNGEMKTVALKNSDFGPLRFKERERERERESQRFKNRFFFFFFDEKKVGSLSHFSSLFFNIVDDEEACCPFPLSI